MYQKFQPIVNELNRQFTLSPEVDRSVDFRIYETYEEGVNDLVAGEVDFMRLGPASYVNAKQRNPDIRLLAMESVNGKRRFRGVIIVPESSPAETIADLRGKRFAFGNKNSTIGRYLSQKLLVQSGVKAKDLAGFDYLGRHDRVAYAVGLGDYDGGAVKESTFLKEQRKGTVRALVRCNTDYDVFVASATGRVREATTNAMSFYSGGGATKKSACPVATRRADGGCGRSLRWSSSKMAKHRLPPPALISPRKPHLQTRHNLCYSVLAYFDNVSQPWVASAKMDEGTFASLRRALLSISSKNILQELRISGFFASEDAMYDFVREGMEEARRFFE